MTASRRTSIPALLVLGVGVLAVALGTPVADAQAPQPAVSLDAILKQVALYDGGIDSNALWKLRDYVDARKDDPAGRAECETKLLAFMKSSATPLAKMTAGRSLRLIAGDTAVPALQAMLADDRSADSALYALQGIRGAVAENALVQAVSTTTGATKTAVIAALGERRTGTAVPALVPLLQQPAFAAASATALGRIGGDPAAAALVTAFAGASGDVKPVVASALLAAADRALAARNSAGASRLYESVAADSSLPVPLRQAAVIGTLSSAGTSAPALLLRLLAGPDADLRQAAISKIADVFTADTIAQVSARLSELPDAAEIQLLAVLATYPADRVGPAALSRLGSESEPVRVAAMKALSSMGGPSAVRPLAERAAAARGAEQAAARAALGMLKGRAVDEEILSQLGRTPADAVAGELLLAVGERRNFSAKSLVTSSLTSSSPVIRTQAYRALRTIGTPSDITLVLDALLASQEEGDRTEAEKTIVALGQKLASLDGRSGTVRARLATEKTTESRVRLIGLLGMMGDPAALPVLRSALKDREADVVDAAVRAMAAWPTGAAREDLMALARDLRDETHRLLAIRGLIRTIGLDTYRDARAAVADLRLAAGFAWRSDERKLVLGVLGRFPCVEALDLARSFLQDPSVKAEAQAAIDRITPRLPKEAIRQ
jgi:HEAT repeat protein